jgi:hypothetical protein
MTVSSDVGLFDDCGIGGPGRVASLRPAHQDRLRFACGLTGDSGARAPQV